MKKRICVAQIGFSSNIKKHAGKIKDIISDHRECDLIVFPELILHGHPSIERPEGLLYRRVKKFYQTMTNDSYDLYKFIRGVNARVIIGELKGKPSGFYNAATYIDKDTVDSYLKTHVHWTENFLPGKELKVFHGSTSKIGISICFDGAFAEVWRVLALKGAEIIVNISATPKTFPVDYIKRRLTGAAINNQVFIVYVNRPDKIFSGHSLILNPMGETLIDAGPGEKIIRCDIDLSEVAKWREKERIYDNRRPLLYRGIATRSTH